MILLNILAWTYFVCLAVLLALLGYGFYFVFKAIEGKTPEEREAAKRAGQELSRFFDGKDP